MPGIHLVHARFGFMETPDVSMALAGAEFFRMPTKRVVVLATEAEI